MSTGEQAKLSNRGVVLRPLVAQDKQSPACQRMRLAAHASELISERRRRPGRLRRVGPGALRRRAAARHGALVLPGHVAFSCDPERQSVRGRGSSLGVLLPEDRIGADPSGHERVWWQGDDSTPAYGADLSQAVPEGRRLDYQVNGYEIFAPRKRQNSGRRQAWEQGSERGDQ